MGDYRERMLVSGRTGRGKMSVYRDWMKWLKGEHPDAKVVEIDSKQPVEPQFKELSDVTIEVLHDFLRSYRKGYKFDLAEYMDNCDFSKEQRGTVLHELCDLSHEDFDEVTVWGC